MGDMSGHPVFDPANGAWFYYEAWTQAEAALAALKGQLHRVAIALAMERCGDGDYEAWVTAYLKKHEDRQTRP